MRTPALSRTCCATTPLLGAQNAHTMTAQREPQFPFRTEHSGRRIAFYYRFSGPYSSIRAISLHCKHRCSMTDQDIAPQSQFRRTLSKVMSMQLATLLVLALIQYRYN